MEDPSNCDGDKEDIDDIDKCLALIEDKYSPKSRKTTSNKKQTDLDELLSVLSKEFDTFGVPTIDTGQPLPKILKQVTKNAHLLVQIHRKTLAQMKDVNINNQCKNVYNCDLEKKIDHLKTRLSKRDEKNALLNNTIIKLTNENNDIRKRELNYKEEMEKLKRYHRSKQDELVHEVNRIKNDNQCLKEMFGQDIGKYVSKDDVVFKLLKQYKMNEEIYQATIQKLEGNNKELMDQILNLKEELGLAICNSQ